MLTIQALALLMLAIPVGASVRQVPEQPEEEVEETKNEVGSSVRALLDASAGLAGLVEETKWDTEVPLVSDPFEQLAKVEYPSQIPAAVEARSKLLSRAFATVPVMVDEIGRCDLESEVGSCRAYFANRWLTEAAGGHFGWRLGPSKEEVMHNHRVVESWRSLWARTSGDERFWSGERAVDARYPRASIETEPLAFIDLETVMTPGMAIAATTSTGTMTIVAGHGFWRTYQWEGASRSALLEPRHERWYGSLGLYFPGPGRHWEEHSGIRRGVLEEGQRHFESVEAALSWVQKQSKSIPVVYRSDGLAVGWSKVLPREQLNVEVWQITIAGSVPRALPGSQDEAIVVSK